MEATFRCEECGKEFKKKNKLNRHVNETHSEAKPYKCEICEAEFKRNSHLTRHKKLKHSDDPKSFHCNIDNCLQKFSTKQHLDRHIKTMHFGDRLKCEECDIIFNKKSMLLKHQSTIHQKEKPFICPIEGCSKGFFREADLIKHRKLVHENPEQSITSIHMKRNFSCFSENSTNEAFSDNFEKGSEAGVSLAGSQKSKGKDKQLYMCFYEDCLKAFSSKYNLRNHIKTHHLGISDFSCPHCESKYKHKKSLQEHIKKSHENEVKTEAKIETVQIEAAQKETVFLEEEEVAV